GKGKTPIDPVPRRALTCSDPRAALSSSFKANASHAPAGGFLSAKGWSGSSDEGGLSSSRPKESNGSTVNPVSAFFQGVPYLIAGSNTQSQTAGADARANR